VALKLLQDGYLEEAKEYRDYLVDAIKKTFQVTASNMLRAGRPRREAAPLIGVFFEFYTQIALPLELAGMQVDHDIYLKQVLDLFEPVMGRQVCQDIITLVKHELVPNIQPGKLYPSVQLLTRLRDGINAAAALVPGGIDAGTMMRIAVESAI
jgi:hypothetical protein